MCSALNARLAALERRITVQHPAPCAVRYLDASPEDTAAVLAILLDAGVLYYGDDGALLRLADDGAYVPIADLLDQHCPS